MRVLVCGSRDWTKTGIIKVMLNGFFMEGDADDEPLVIIEGGARGADQIARQWAESMTTFGVELETYPAKWPPHGSPKRDFAIAGRQRNQRMLDEGRPSVVLAFKDDFNWKLDKGGTEHMCRIAADAGVPVYVTGRVMR